MANYRWVSERQKFVELGDVQGPPPDMSKGPICFMDETGGDAPGSMLLVDLIKVLQDRYDSLPESRKNSVTVTVGSSWDSGFLSEI